jgi:hypothetical protein
MAVPGATVKPASPTGGPVQIAGANGNGIGNGHANGNGHKNGNGDVNVEKTDAEQAAVAGD